MNSPLFTSVVLFCMVLSIRSDIFDYEGAVGRGNELVDKLLSDIVHEKGHEYDPYKMDNHTFAFWRKVIVNITGEAKLHDGFIRGLTSLHRADNCYLYEDGDRLKVRADLGGGELNLHYLGTVTFMGYGPTIQVYGKVPYIEVMMQFSVNANDGKEAKLEQFYIEDIRGMQVWITGLGPLNWAVNTFISATSTIFQRYLYRAVESRIESHIAERISNYQFPVHGP